MNCVKYQDVKELNEYNLRRLYVNTIMDGIPINVSDSNMYSAYVDAILSYDHIYNGDNENLKNVYQNVLLWKKYKPNYFRPYDTCVICGDNELVKRISITNETNTEMKKVCEHCFCTFNNIN
jgi:hypothetical protein